MKKETLRVSHLCLKYKYDQILSDVSFSAFAGEIVSVVGNNGVGKTILGKILAGELKEDSGSVMFHGENQSRIRYIPEEEQILKNLTVAENILIGQEVTASCYLNRSRIYKQVQQYFEKYHLNINPKQKGIELTSAQKRIVMLVRQLIQMPELLIIDGVLDFISHEDIQGIINLLKDMRAQGTAIIYLTYNYRLAMYISDRMLFLQKGMIVYEVERSEFIEENINRVSMNFMKEIEWKPCKKTDSAGEEVLRVHDLTTDILKKVSFTLKRGELVGMIGMRNNCITEFLECLGGYRKITGGKIWVDGKPVDIRNPKAAIKSRIRMCKDNHQDVLLNLSESIKMNLSLSILNRISKNGFVQKKREDILAREYCKKFDIRYDIQTKLTEMNYAAVSKVSIASCMVSNPRVLILNESMRGLDEEGMLALYEVLNEVRKECGIILSFSKIEKELNICDRIVFWGRDGIVEELGRDMYESSIYHR